jgi:hypothetical protein
MKYATAIKIIIFIFLPVSNLMAQVKSISITPNLGLEYLFSRLQFKRFENARIQNNRFEVSLKTGLKLEFQYKNNAIFSIDYSNLQSGIAMGVVHNSRENNYTGSILNQYIETSFNNKRISFNYTKFKKNNNKVINLGIKIGLAFDIRSNENDSSEIIFIGNNNRGEMYYLDDSAYYRNLFSLAIPIEIIIKFFENRKLPVYLAFGYGIGLTKHATFGVDYVNLTTNKTETVMLKNYGSTLYCTLNFPIKIYKRKNVPK